MAALRCVQALLAAMRAAKAHIPRVAFEIHLALCAVPLHVFLLLLRELWTFVHWRRQRCALW